MTVSNLERRLARLFDILCAAFGLLFLMPVLTLVGLATLCTDGPPIFFRQVRIGRNGKPFPIWKYRTMAVDIPGSSVTAAGDHRITRLGAILRRWKIDEFPQLLNVLTGHMSLVGPRPEVPAYVDLRSPIWNSILSVRPGITDLATLLYRNEEQLLSRSSDPDSYYREIILPAKLQLSITYLQNKSFRHDLKLLLLTIESSISRKAIERDQIFPKRAGGCRYA